MTPNNLRTLSVGCRSLEAIAAAQPTSWRPDDGPGQSSVRCSPFAQGTAFTRDSPSPHGLNLPSSASFSLCDLAQHTLPFTYIDNF